MSTPNHFRQAGRYAAQLDPAGFLRWLLGPAGERYRFLGWLDTPAAPAGACCTAVAELVERSVLAFHWAVAIEFQSEPDPDLFGRLLECLGRLWREQRPTDKPEQRFQVAAAVLNLSGAARTSRVMNCGEGIRTVLEVREINAASLDAASLMEAIDTGEQAKALLPWVALLRGGSEPAILEQWKQVAQEEPDAQRRSDYTALALVFADRADTRAAWQQALEGWSVTESPQVLLWQEEARRRGMAEGKAACVVELLENRFKKIPATVISRIKGTEDAALLDEWFKAALTAGTLAEFRKVLKEKEG